MGGISGILLLMLGSTPQATELDRCRMALQFCAADGPVQLTHIRDRREATYEYQNARLAAEQLQDAAKSLARCAGNMDFEDDCTRRFREVRDATDQYQQAIQELDEL